MFRVAKALMQEDRDATRATDNDEDEFSPYCAI